MLPIIPSSMMPPPQQQGGMNQMMSGLPPDLVQKILKDVTKGVSQTLTGMASQAIGAGVPWGHVMGELAKMAPPGMALSSSGGPGGPNPMNGGGGNNQPPQQPGGTAKQDTQQTPPAMGDTQNLGPMLAQSAQPQPMQQQAPMQQSYMSGPTQVPTQGFFDPGGFNAQDNSVRMPGGFMNGWGTQRIKDQQEIMGKQPIQPTNQLTQDVELAKNKATLAKDEKTRMDAYFKNINEPLSSAKDLSLVESALTGIDDITKLLGVQSDANGNVTLTNEKLLRNPNFLSKNRQQLQRARDLYINKTLRRDSGAAIGKKEENDFKNIVGFEIGMKSFMQNPKVIAKAMLESKDQLIRDRGRLSPNEKQRSLVTGLRAKGFKDPEIYAYLQRSGEVS